MFLVAKRLLISSHLINLLESFRPKRCTFRTRLFHSSNSETKEEPELSIEKPVINSLQSFWGTPYVPFNYNVDGVFIAEEGPKPSAMAEFRRRESANIKDNNEDDEEDGDDDDDDDDDDDGDDDDDDGDFEIVEKFRFQIDESEFERLLERRKQLQQSEKLKVSEIGNQIYSDNEEAQTNREFLLDSSILDTLSDGASAIGDTSESGKLVYRVEMSYDDFQSSIEAVETSTSNDSSSELDFRGIPGGARGTSEDIQYNSFGVLQAEEAVKLAMKAELDRKRRRNYLEKLGNSANMEYIEERDSKNKKLSEKVFKQASEGMNKNVPFGSRWVLECPDLSQSLFTTVVYLFSLSFAAFLADLVVAVIVKIVNQTYLQFRKALASCSLISFLVRPVIFSNRTNTALSMGFSIIYASFLFATICLCTFGLSDIIDAFEDVQAFVKDILFFNCSTR